MTDPGAWGIATGYHDAMGNWRQVPEAAVREVLLAIGADPDRDAGPPADRGPLVVRPSSPVPSGMVHLEDGTTMPARGGRRDQAEPGHGEPAQADLPLGYHVLETDDGWRRPLIVSPGLCPPPRDDRGWGWSAQLYATRSRRSWGIGDLADLGALGRWAVSAGADLVLINPLHAPAPVPPQEPSPYSPSSRCFANPLYLRIEDIPGAAHLPDLETLAVSGRALNLDRQIDRDRVWALKSQALEALFAADPASAPDFECYLAERGATLEGYATWCALAELHGVPWQRWPMALRHPGAPGVAQFQASVEGRQRIRYYAWLQWQLDRQLSSAARAIGIVQDLAIGTNPGGADAWLWQDQVAVGMRVGAPPDEFNTLGQDWGLPPWNPWRLAESGFDPFIQTVRAGLRHGGGLRVDHVMGLFRLFWIPEGRSAGEGTYVRYPHRELLDILALEATRAGAYVVGEDLGTVEPWVREALGAAGVRSYRLWWFEPERPAAWPRQALAAVSTHDLPTIAGVWTGSDLAAQRAMDLQPNEEAAAALRARLEEWTGAAPWAPLSEVVERTYQVMADAPCELATASLDDVCQVEERPNFPGTTDQWPNWRLALPQPLENIVELPLAAAIAAALGRRHQPQRQPPEPPAF